MSPNEKEIMTVPMFDGTNIVVFKRRMEFKLRIKDLWRHVDPSVNGIKLEVPGAATDVSAGMGKPSRVEEAFNEELDGKARAMILMHVTDKVAVHFDKIKTAAGVWKELDRKWLSNSLATLSMVRREFESFSISRGANIVDELARMEVIVRRLEGTELELRDRDIVYKTQFALPEDEWLGFLNAYNGSLVGTGKMIPDWLEFQTILTEEFIRRNPGGQVKTSSRIGGSQGVAFYGKGPALNGGGGTQKFQKYEFKGECYNCGKMGHRKADCRSKPKQNSSNGTSGGFGGSNGSTYSSAKMVAKQLDGKSKVAPRKKEDDISWAFGASGAIEFIPEELENEYSEDIGEYYGGNDDEYDEFNPCKDDFNFNGDLNDVYSWYEDPSLWCWTKVDLPVAKALLTGGEGSDIELLTQDQARLLAIREAQSEQDKARIELVEFDKREADLRQVGVKDAIEAAGCLGEDPEIYIAIYDAQVEQKRSVLVQRLELLTARVNSIIRGQETAFITTGGPARIAKESYLIDSGASDHMVNDSSVFVSMVPSKRVIVTANGGKVTAKGVGDVELMNSDGKKITLSDVLFVPTMIQNLLSQTRFDIVGVTTTFKNGLVIGLRDGLKVFDGMRDSQGLWNLKLMSPNVPKVNAVKILDRIDTETWHRRLGHVNYADLSDMGLGKVKPGQKCDICLTSKGTSLAFNKKVALDQGKYEKGEFMHSDYCGPMKTVGLSGEVGFWTYIDDKTSRVVVILKKAQVKQDDVFEKHVAMVERQTGNKLKKFRCDNGTEYQSNRFLKYLDSNGVLLDATNPYTPQQNGKAERFNRTLVEMSRCMLKEAKLPFIYWPFAIMTAAYIRNRCPTTVGGKRLIPEEAWTGDKVDYQYLRVFGCRGWVHVPGIKRTKLDDVGTSCRLMGYSNNGYVLLLESGKFVFSRDVRFDEATITKVTLEDGSDSEEEETDLVDSQGESQAQNEEELEDFDITQDTIQEFYDFEDEVVHNQDQEEMIELEDTLLEPVCESQGRPKRLTKVPDRYAAHVNQVSYAFNSVLPTFTEALKDTDWRKAVQLEFDSLVEMGTWSEVNMVAGRKLVTSKWVFDKKLDKDGNLLKYKARLVARGFTQVDGIDYTETFAPVCHTSIIRMIMAISAVKDYTVKQFDIKGAFLNGILEEEIYLQCPDGYNELSGRVVKPGTCLKLNKALYGLKQAARQWFLALKELILRIGMIQSKTEDCLFYHNKNGIIVLLVVHVDDGYLVGNNVKYMDMVIKKLSARYVTTISAGDFFLSMEVIHDAEGIILYQGRYMLEKLSEFDMVGCKNVETPMDTGFPAMKKSEEKKPEEYKQAIGSMIYLSTQTRPDLSFAVGYLSRYMDSYVADHWTAVKRIWRYISGTKDCGLRYKRGGDVTVTCYVDADFAGCRETRRSTTGYVIMLGGGAIDWRSKKQNTVALSSTEAEYMALADATTRLIWIRNILEEIGFKQGTTTIYEDNNSCAFIANDAGSSDRTKHIDVRYHFVREKIQDGSVKVVRIDTKDQVADGFTKPFGILKMNEFKKSIGIVSIGEKKEVESSAAGLSANGLKTYSQVLQGGVLDNGHGLNDNGDSIVGAYVATRQAGMGDYVATFNHNGLAWMGE
jgi:hypothetical protein